MLLDEVSDQTEVENDDASFGGDQHIGRLDIAMELAMPVQLRESVGELLKPAPEPADAQRRCRR